MSYEGLTGCDESIRCFLGSHSFKSKTQDGRIVAYFDVSWGINNIDRLLFPTWRHCIAYGERAEQILSMPSGSYLRVTGWIVTNPVYDEAGDLKIDIKKKPITKEYLIVTSIIRLNRENKEKSKQAVLVEVQ